MSVSLATASVLDSAKDRLTAPQIANQPGASGLLGELEAEGMTKRAKHHPRCIRPGCKRYADRWDGGVQCHVVDPKTKKLGVGPIIYLCKKHDPGHKHFDLPDTLEGALADLFALRADIRGLRVAIEAGTRLL